MKYLKRFNESSDEETVEVGHKHSWADIKERLLYLTDIGFEIDKESKKQYFRDETGHKCDITEAHCLNTEITLKKRYLNEDDVSSRGVESGRRENRWDYYVKWDDSILEMWQAIASVCAHFDECQHNITQTAEGWELRFIIYTPVEEQVRATEKEKEIDEDVREGISNGIERARTNILSQFSSTTYDKLVKNKLGETMWDYQGSYEEGFLIMAVNLSEIRTQKRNVMMKLEGGLENLERATGRTGKVELREITGDDLKKLHKIKSVSDRYDFPYFEARYLGLMGYIIEFDYKKLYDKRRDERLL